MKVSRTFPASDLATYTKVTGYVRCLTGKAPFLVKVKDATAWIVSKDCFALLAIPGATCQCVKLSKAELAFYKKHDMLVDVSRCVEKEVTETTFIFVDKSLVS